MSLDKNMDYRIQRASNPERIVVDFLILKFPIRGKYKANSNLIASISSQQFDIGTARVVLNLKKLIPNIL